MPGRNKEDAALLQQALDHLAGADPHMSRAIATIGPPPPRHRPASFATLMDVIIAQQVSTASAAAISGRLTERLSRVTPEAFIALTDADLRAVGFSRQKTVYGRDLAAHFLDGRVSPAKLRRMEDEAAIESLSAVKGIGRWSAEVFLLFALAAAGCDAGAGSGAAGRGAAHEGTEDAPEPKKLLKLAELWRPYRSYAARMLWHYYRHGQPL